MIKTNNIREMDKQIKVYSVNTKAFYIGEEKEKHDTMLKNEHEQSYIKDYIFLNVLDNADVENEKDKERYDKQLEEYREYDRDEFISICNYKAPENYQELEGEELEQAKKSLNIRTKIKRYVTELINRNKISKDKSYNKLFEHCTDKIEKLKDEDLTGVVKRYDKLKKEISKLKKEINSLVNSNVLKRELDARRINLYRAVALFDSFLLRTIEADNNLNNDYINEDIIIVQKTHLNLMKQLLEQGFTYKNEDYIYYTSSAGQIRDQKLIFIKKSVWEKYEKTLMCGLTEEDINEQGGININKFLAYKALTTSSTNEWTDDVFGGFDIKKAIVLNDFETGVTGKVDYIDNQTFEIHKNKEMKIDIEHSDGCGWILPSKSDKNFMTRLPFIKGLLTPVNFLEYCKVHNNGNYKVTDIYGRKWDLLEDEIEVVFFKSQFKLHKYYANWAEYQDAFIDNNCHASICNVEDDYFERASLSYQMWQSLNRMTGKEVQLFTNRVKSKIEAAYVNRDKMLEMLGVNSKDDSKNKTYLQKILKVYPELLGGDPYLKSCISDSISSMKNDARQGKIEVDAKYSYILPDVYAWLQYTISGIKNPNGLLDNGEVSCKLYKEVEELDVLRSPSLSREHAIRRNVTNHPDKKSNINKWFITNGIYTSCFDLISKLLQFDVDGDKALIVAEKSIVEIAKRHNKEDNIVPLYYEMGQAEAVDINPQNIYTGLSSAFRYGNVGVYSNYLTKLWNVKDVNMEYIKINTALSNYSIDASKTLEMKKPPREYYKEMNEYMKELKLPHFFKYVKDNYSKDKIEQEQDKDFTSTVNKFVAEIDKIKRGTYEFENCGNFRRTNLMNDSKVEIDKDLIEFYDKLNDEMQKNIYVDAEGTREEKFNKTIEILREEFEKYCIENNIEFTNAVDMVIKRLYTTRKDASKKLLFEMLGDQILANLEKNIKKSITSGEYIMCQDCGTRVKKQSNAQKRCKKCTQFSKKAS